MPLQLAVFTTVLHKYVFHKPDCVIDFPAGSETPHRENMSKHHFTSSESFRPFNMLCGSVLCRTTFSCLTLSWTLSAGVQHLRVNVVEPLSQEASGGEETGAFDGSCGSDNWHAANSEAESWQCCIKRGVQAQNGADKAAGRKCSKYFYTIQELVLWQ